MLSIYTCLSVLGTVLNHMLSLRYLRLRPCVPCYLALPIQVLLSSLSLSFQRLSVVALPNGKVHPFKSGDILESVWSVSPSKTLINNSPFHRIVCNSWDSLGDQVSQWLQPYSLLGLCEEYYL